MPSNPSISIQFLGAAGTVTGSKHLLKTPELTILVDCGLFQGLKALRLKNWESLPIDPKNINVLLITHAHLDHTGYLPLLVKNGFKGRILMTSPTKDLAEVILRDSAHIQEEDAALANKGNYSKHNPALPLYTEKEVEDVLPLIETVEDNTLISLSDSIQVRFIKNGHILGSCYIELHYNKKSIVFSGDIGREHSELLAAPSPLVNTDFLIMESTYGDKNHPDVKPSEQLAHIISDTVQKHGTILIPSFAVGRTQELMYIINKLKQSNQIPPIPIYVDSPMGADATEIFVKYPSWHKLSANQVEDLCKDIHIIRDSRETHEIIGMRKSKIIIAGSGMVTGGRMLEYLKYYGDDPKHTIILTGYQAEGTRGRALKEGKHEIKIHGRYYQINASIEEISSLSAHGDQSEMLNWIKKATKKPERIFLVHGEIQALQAFKILLEKELQVSVIIPHQGEEINLF